MRDGTIEVTADLPAIGLGVVSAIACANDLWLNSPFLLGVSPS
jgi:hypothetical protein